MGLLATCAGVFEAIRNALGQSYQHRLARRLGEIEMHKRAFQQCQEEPDTQWHTVKA